MLSEVDALKHSIHAQAWRQAVLDRSDKNDCYDGLVLVWNAVRVIQDQHNRCNYFGGFLYVFDFFQARSLG